MQPVRVGVIGVGYLGRYHAEKYAAMPETELVGVCDVDLARAREVADALGCEPFVEYRRLLERVEAVSVVVPTTLHHRVGVDCLEHGVDVLMEKPITTTLEEADDLIAWAERKQRILQVGHLERYNPAILAMRPLLTYPLFIEAHRLSRFQRRGTDVDVILDLMIHDLDIIFSIVDAEITMIHAAGAPVITEFTDIANARIIFENGVTANVTASRISVKAMRRMRIFQPGAYLSVDFIDRTVMAGRPVTVTGPDGEPVLQLETKNHTFGKEDPLELELRDFVANVRFRRQPAVGGAEGRRALAVALEMVAQIRENRMRMERFLSTRPNTW